MKLEIHGLTDKQVEMLDKIWACDTQEELTEFLRTLPSAADQIMARTLQEMVLDAILEDGWTEDDTHLAKKMLRNIGVKV